MRVAAAAAEAVMVLVVVAAARSVPPQAERARSPEGDNECRVQRDRRMKKSGRARQACGSEGGVWGY